MASHNSADNIGKDITNRLKQRLLRNIAEVQTRPYPNIALHIQEDDLTSACLILTVEEYGPMHMTIDFPEDFPLDPPFIWMDSDVDYPNASGDHICVSMFCPGSPCNWEAYTPAYTLKGIAIQQLSFFSSDSVIIKAVRKMNSSKQVITHVCSKCRFGVPEIPSTQPPPIIEEGGDVNPLSPQKRASLGRGCKSKETTVAIPLDATASAPESEVQITKSFKGIQKMKLPAEILLLFCDMLEYDDVMAFAQTWDTMGVTVARHSIIRTRELQCFLFKTSYMTSRLGVGVNIARRGRIGSFESKFDLLSIEGFEEHDMQWSVQGIPFDYWLGLPISHDHWAKVRDDVTMALLTLSEDAGLTSSDPGQVIYAFMNDIVVKLNTQMEQAPGRSRNHKQDDYPKSTLIHSSEKAIESYFHLFHLLLCLTTEDPTIVKIANDTLSAFGRGENSKKDYTMIKSIVHEAITRNVVWMLDSKGAGMAELAYLEPISISEYRLKKTFEASKTSYRLLMFLNLFRKVARGSPCQPLSVLRDEAFDRRGAPPRGSAKGLADSIKHIHQVSFPEFFAQMGMQEAFEEGLTTFLKDCIHDSVKKGYSRMPQLQGEALTLRLLKESDVEVVPGIWRLPIKVESLRFDSFFPLCGSKTY
ncbi:hypothetical protein IFR05_002131 [Cadophora sp. M221]|nr:hypothetical protein IFR05_002131 [Cadophora sp. M221]